MNLVFRPIPALILGALLLAGCGKSKVETAKSVEAQVQKMLEGVPVEDAAQFEADKQRVRDLHALAALIDAYHAKKGAYPLADPERKIKNVNISTQEFPTSDAVVPLDAFVAELKSVLGDDVAVPLDPMPMEDRTKLYIYSVYGSTYTVACVLYHHATFAEKIMDHYCQYRLGSNEDPNLPILVHAKVIDGTSTVPARKYSRQ
jgi:hypothetical protein